jgi:glutamate synthase domain-containing protein 2
MIVLDQFRGGLFDSRNREKMVAFATTIIMMPHIIITLVCYTNKIATGIAYAKFVFRSMDFHFKCKNRGFLRASN